MPKSTYISIVVNDPALLPTYAREGDAGADLRAAEDLIIPAGERALVKTGVKLALPDGVVALVHPRSGLALKHGVTVLNTPGTIDSGYRGEIGVILYNTSEQDFAVVTGDRIAQLVFQEYLTADFSRESSLDETDRGEGGFGSTGIGEI
jgi:dUTP pyrophosphatase